MMIIVIIMIVMMMVVGMVAVVVVEMKMFGTNNQDPIMTLMHIQTPSISIEQTPSSDTSSLGHT